MVSLAQRLDSDITAFTRKIAGQMVAPEGELRITTNDSLLVHLLTPLFASFRNSCPVWMRDVFDGCDDEEGLGQDARV
jgi:DNA-binding transcriptional LysR family regulator